MSTDARPYGMRQIRPQWLWCMDKINFNQPNSRAEALRCRMHSLSNSRCSAAGLTIYRLSSYSITVENTMLSMLRYGSHMQVKSMDCMEYGLTSQIYHSYIRQYLADLSNRWSLPGIIFAAGSHEVSNLLRSLLGNKNIIC